MMLALLKDLRRDDQGATLLEFALITPAVLTLLMGLLDVSYNLYANSVLHGAIQEAARQSTFEGASSSSIDATITETAQSVVGDADLAFTRKSYSNFSGAGQPEDYNDLNSDGVCNNNEPFEDANANGNWDADRGIEGMGGARDVVVYEVEISYTRLFPIFAFIETIPEKHKTTSTTVLRNQPFDNNIAAPEVKNCI